MTFLDTKTFCRKEEIQGEIPSFKTCSVDVFKVVWASVLETFLVALVTLFDGIQVADIGNAANAAVTICKQPYFILISLSNCISVILTVIISRRRGQKDIEGANKAMHLGIDMMFVMSVFFGGLFILLARPICLMMQAKEDTINYAIRYLSIISAGFPLNALAIAFNAAQKGMGNTKISMVSNLVSNLVNIFFNYCLIKGNLGMPELGITGAAIATVIGQSVNFIIALVALCRQKDYIKFSFLKLFRFDRQTFTFIANLLPSVVIEQLLMRFGFIMFAIIVNGLGSTETYIQGVCNDINSLLFTISDGFSIGTSAIIGRKLGEGRKDLAIVYSKVAIMLSVSTGVLICILMILLRKQLVGLYQPDSDYKMNVACNCLYIAAAGCVLQNIQWVNTGILRTAGDTKFTAISSLISVAIVRPILSYLLIYVVFNHVNEYGETIKGLGVYGAWIAQAIDQLSRMTNNLVRFHSRKWTRIRV